MDKKNDSIVFSKLCKMLLQKNKLGFLEPFAYDVENFGKDGRGTKISQGTIYWDFIKFVRFSSQTTNKKTGQSIPGYLEVYQYAMAFTIIKAAMNLQSEDVISAISRQAGKSHLIRLVLGFLIVYLPLHKDIPEERFFAVFAAPKKSIAKDQVRKLKPIIRKAIELFNKTYPYSKLITRDDDRDLIDNQEKMEINRMFGDRSIPYSSLDVLTLNKVVVNAGFTAHIIFVDEAQEVNNESFLTQVKPFVTRTGGFVCAIGTTLPDDENLLYNMYKSNEIKEERRMFFDWNDVVALKMLRSEQEAIRYKRRVEKEIREKGINSDYVQTQYFVSFDVKGDRFITKSGLKDNNILTGGYGFTPEELKEYSDRDDVYIIAGLDTAIGDDYAALVIGLAKEVDGSIMTEVRKIVVYNKDIDSISPEELVSEVAHSCSAFKIDTLIVDTTSNQKDRAIYLRKTLKERKINTQILPFSYANKNKRRMMGFLEDSIYNQNITLPKEEVANSVWEVKELIDELCYLKKTVSSSGIIKYQAPDTSDSYDDLVMALAQFNFGLSLLISMIESNKLIKMGSGIEYYAEYNKYNDAEDHEEERASFYVM